MSDHANPSLAPRLDVLATVVRAAALPVGLRLRCRLLERWQGGLAFVAGAPLRAGDVVSLQVVGGVDGSVPQDAAVVSCERQEAILVATCHLLPAPVNGVRYAG